MICWHIRNQYIIGGNNADLSMIQILMKKEFYYGYYRGTDEHRWIQGELYPNRPYYWGYEPRYPGRIYKKIPFMEFKISNLEEVDFMN